MCVYKYSSSSLIITTTMTDDDWWNYYVHIDFPESGSPVIAGQFFDSEKTALGILHIDDSRSWTTY